MTCREWDEINWGHGANDNKIIWQWDQVEQRYYFRAKGDNPDCAKPCAFACRAVLDYFSPREKPDLRII